MSHPQDPDQLTTITTATSEFGAQLLVAILDDAGIEAFAFGSTGTTLGVTGQSTNPRWGVPIQVRRKDVEAAKTTLLANKRDSVDINWMARMFLIDWQVLRFAVDLSCTGEHDANLRVVHSASFENAQLCLGIDV